MKGRKVKIRKLQSASDKTHQTKKTALGQRLNLKRRLKRHKQKHLMWAFAFVAVLALLLLFLVAQKNATHQPAPITSKPPKHGQSVPKSATKPQAPSAQPQVGSTQPELVYQPEPGASAQNPALSPDSQTMLFTVFHSGYNKGSADLRLLPLQGARNVTKLVDDPGASAVNLPGSSWNARTGRIAFASDRQDRDEIWTITPNGQDLFRVTNHPGDSGFIEPSFSPDGNQIVFEEDTGKSEDTQTGSILRVNSDGNNLTRLIDGPATNTDNRQPNWSPSGDRVLFQRKQRGAQQWTLYTMNSDGSDLRAITDGTSDDTDASWSPDGKFIVYSSNHGNLSAANLFIVPANGGEPHRVTTDNSRYDGAVSWSPDGNWFYYESKTDAAEGAPTEIWRVAASK